TKVLGTTLPSVAIPPLTVTWDETPDKAKKTVTLAVAKVSVVVSISARVLIDKAIDRKTPCYKHVWEHEKKHLDAYKRGASGHAADLRRAVADATVPQRRKPLEVPEKDARAFKAKAEERMGAALE